jgi:hypothetical protein
VGPESITPVWQFSIQTLAQGLWIPGLRQKAHPGMTIIESSNNAIHTIGQTGDKTGRA